LRKSGTSSTRKSNQNNYFTIVDAAEIVVRFINKENTFLTVKMLVKIFVKMKKFYFRVIFSISSIYLLTIN